MKLALRASTLSALRYALPRLSSHLVHRYVPRSGVLFTALPVPSHMNTTLVLAALVVGIVTGLVFAGLRVPLPAPPSLPGIVGIVGIYVGYRVVEVTGIGFDLLGWLGLG